MRRELYFIIFKITNKFSNYFYKKYVVILRKKQRKEGLR